MAAWRDVESAAPEFAAAVQAAFDAHTHKVLATLRASGAPRLSGSELAFRDGDAWFGVMAGSRKLADLGRDRRVELHSAPCSEDLAGGDARLSGRALAARDAESHRRFSGNPGAGAPDFDLFRLDITAVVLTRLGGTPPDRLVIESWTPEGGWRRQERA